MQTPRSTHDLPCVCSHNMGKSQVCFEICTNEHLLFDFISNPGYVLSPRGHRSFLITVRSQSCVRQSAQRRHGAKWMKRRIGCFPSQQILPFREKPSKVLQRCCRVLAEHFKRESPLHAALAFDTTQSTLTFCASLFQRLETKTGRRRSTSCSQFVPATDFVTPVSAMDCPL